MKIRSFQQEDFEILNKWLELHQHSQVSWDELPKLGYVAEYKDDDGRTVMAAIAFIRLVEGNYAMADSLTINPAIKSLKTKARAFDAVTSKLIEVAKALRIKNLIAYTSKEGVVKRSSKHGFCLVNQKLLIKILD
jgi:hypothetical protein